MGVKKDSIDKRAGDRHKPRRGIYIDPELWEALAALARAADRPVSWEVRRILEDAVKSRRQ